MVDYDFIQQIRDGDQLANLTDLTNREINLYLNEPGDAKGTLDLASNQADRTWLQPGFHEAIIRRNDVPLETVWQLVTAQPTPDNEKGGTLQLSWMGIMSYMAGLTLPSGFTDSDTQDRVAFGMIDTAQTTEFDYGIIDGASTVGQPVKTFTLNEAADVRHSIKTLSERANGFDFNIGTDREFNTFFPFRGTDKSGDIVLKHGRQGLVGRIQEDATPGAIVNHAIIRGGDGQSQESEDAASIARFGRRTAVIVYSDVIADATTLKDYADEVVNSRKDPTLIPTFVMDTLRDDFDFDAISLGDTVRLFAEIGVVPFFEIDDVFRVVAIQIKVDAEDQEMVTYQLNTVESA